MVGKMVLGAIVFGIAVVGAAVITGKIEGIIAAVVGDAVTSIGITVAATAGGEPGFSDGI